MKTVLAAATQKLRKAERAGYIRRVMWLSFEDRLHSVFSEIDSQGVDAGELGNFYLSSSKQSFPAYGQPYVFRFNSLNQAQVSVGWRRMGVWHSLGNGELLKPNEAMENGAAISFSQDITGKIMVLLSPYKSDVAKVNEDNFILVFGVEPNDLTEERIRKLFKIFFRYCAATSMVSVGSYSDYVFRLWLGLRDIRNRKIQKVAILRFFEKVLIVGLAAAGVWATLYTSSKWPIH
ncbi:hypothetical protein [Thiobacillus sp.]|uniref:hypothetical protein n=1 Tax=Thiobacillus sp. TaxID=924 RepID=UPI0025CF5159|nr:hypothetical protein [Thiobacillus sp.]